MSGGCVDSGFQPRFYHPDMGGDSVASAGLTDFRADLVDTSGCRHAIGAREQFRDGSTP